MKIQDVKLMFAKRDDIYTKANYPKNFYPGTGEFLLPKRDGVEVYRSFTDDELLEILRSKGELICGVPSESHVLDVYADYIKYRFLTWNAALIAAGFDVKPDGSDEYVEIARELTADKPYANVLYRVYMLLVFDHRELQIIAAKAMSEFDEKYRIKKRDG